MEKELSVVISSCDKFSDLWDKHIELYQKNWCDNGAQTYLVTDKPTDRSFDGVKIIVADGDMDFPSRIKYALQFVETPYVLLTLDDYFLVNPVNNRNIETLVNKAKVEKIDYLLLYDRRKTDPKKYEKTDVLHSIDLQKKYAVTLYPAIWSVEFLKKTVKEDLSPWLYEASLTKTAREENAKCAFSHTGSFDILDVVRKGKLLHKAVRYFKKNNIEIGNREIISYGIEFKLWVQDMISWHAPRGLFIFIKKVAKRFGVTFYSED